MLNNWIYAIKINSWPKILVPFILGQAIGVQQTQQFDLLAFVLGLAFTIAGLVFIVLCNDLRDAKVDRIKRNLFPDGCSPKTIPDGILSYNSLLIATILAMITAFSAAFIAGYLFDLKQLFPLSICCCLVFVAYSLPPLQLNYRGGGELLEMLGVGLLLPIFSIYLQAQEWPSSLSYPILITVCLWALTSALASGLSDEVSDLKGNKRTFTTMFGNLKIKKTIRLLSVVALVPLAFTGIVFTKPLIAVTTILVTVAFSYYKLLQLNKTLPQAKTNNFKHINIFKKHLHQMIWFGMLLLSLGLIFDQWQTT